MLNVGATISNDQIIEFFTALIDVGARQVSKRLYEMAFNRCLVDIH